MRGIKFRGLSDNMRGDTSFVYGYLTKDCPKITGYYTTHPYRIHWNEGNARHNKPVRVGSVSQFTGISDKNNKEIYEEDGDVVFKLNEVNIEDIE